MDWYFIEQNEDQRVPTVQETSKMACAGKWSSPADAWLDWEATLNERFGSLDKTCANTEGQVSEGYSFDKTCANTAEQANEGYSFDIQLSLAGYCYGTSDNSNNSNTYGGFSSVNCNARNSLHLDEQPDYQLQSLCQNSENLSTMQQMDNIFMNSFIDGNPCDMEDPFQSICTSTPSANLLTEMLMDSSNIKKESSCTDDSKCLKETDLEDQILGDWEDELRGETNLYNLPSCSTPAYSVITDDSSKLKGPLLTNTLNTSGEAERQVKEEESSEATALQELEIVMTKLNPDTRICFRDALYRLASRSANSTLETSSAPTVCSDRSRHVRTKYAELETNAMDRAIANLMFNKLDSGPPDFSCVSSTHDKGALATNESQECHLTQPQVVPSLLPLSLSCEEVDFPYLDRENKSFTSLVYGF